MARFARIDPRMPEPRPVLGWYDTDAVTYPKDALPPEHERVPMEDAVWDDRVLGSFYGFQGGKLICADRPVGQHLDLPRTVLKTVLLQRLIEAGRLRNFRAVLGLDEPAAELDDARLELRERWLANDAFRADEVPLRRALAAADCEPDEVLGAA